MGKWVEVSIENLLDSCILKVKVILFMKHEVTTYNTKKMLATSLKKAMKHKPFSKITVSEIIADCGVNRKTFYYHFEDIYALLTWMFEEEAIDIVKRFDLLTDYEQAIRFVMDYVDQNEYLVNCACHSISRDEMKRFFCADFVGIVTSVIDAAEVNLEKKLPIEFKKFIALFYTEALAGMLIDWVREKENRDKEKTLVYLSAIIRTAIDSLKLYANDVSKLV